jgi:hypothetical protein
MLTALDHLAEFSDDFAEFARQSVLARAQLGVQFVQPIVNQPTKLAAGVARDCLGLGSCRLCDIARGAGGVILDVGCLLKRMVLDLTGLFRRAALHISLRGIGIVGHFCSCLAFCVLQRDQPCPRP